MDDHITKEVELLIQRCTAAGISAGEAHASLCYRVFRMNIEAGAAEEAAREGPLNRLLQDAYDYLMAGKKKLHLETCEAWLLAKFGARIGDVVEINRDTWEEPRQVLVDRFRILWMKYDGLQTGYMWFQGPCSATPAFMPRKESGEQGVSVLTPIEVVSPSARMRNLYPDRFAPRIRLDD
ncbi:MULTISPECIES: hypothetical protein [unclassified Variovorax]|uniref:hypothetical protein n=1 Tax=unclassified Variovorax TaxID=663243 RepID=UPI00076D456F|nr:MULTISPECIES: hypothetical protein [unclassified Variovorax]KWT98058.1 hypothetical protein APY03_0729 [Variovorax sp. WDL1]